MRQSIGRESFDISFVTPAPSSTFIIPFQRHSIPSIDTETETASEAPFIMASPSCAILPQSKANTKEAETRTEKTFVNTGIDLSLKI